MSELKYPELTFTALDWEAVYSARVREALNRLRAANDSIEPPFARLMLLIAARDALAEALVWCASEPPPPVPGPTEREQC